MHSVLGVSVEIDKRKNFRDMGNCREIAEIFFFMYVEKRREEVSECHKAFIIHLF